MGGGDELDLAKQASGQHSLPQPSREENAAAGGEEVHERPERKEAVSTLSAVTTGRLTVQLQYDICVLVLNTKKENKPPLDGNHN